MTRGSEEAQPGEKDRQYTLDDRRPVAAELPAEVLPVIEELLPNQRHRTTGIFGPRGVHRVVEQRRLGELLPCENRPQRRPGDGVALVQIRIEMRTDRNKEIDAQANDDDQRCDREKLGPQQHAGIRYPDVCQDGRSDEDAHQVIGGAQSDQIHHDEEQVIATRRIVSQSTSAMDSTLSV